MDFHNVAYDVVARLFRTLCGSAEPKNAVTGLQLESQRNLEDSLREAYKRGAADTAVEHDAATQQVKRDAASRVKDLTNKYNSSMAELQSELQKQAQEFRSLTAAFADERARSASAAAQQLALVVDLRAQLASMQLSKPPLCSAETQTDAPARVASARAARDGAAAVEKERELLQRLREADEKRARAEADAVAQRRAVEEAMAEVLRGEGEKKTLREEIVRLTGAARARAAQGDVGGGGEVAELRARVAALERTLAEAARAHAEEVATITNETRRILEAEKAMAKAAERRVMEVGGGG
jgi:hypothetical protein